jgi:hypothetical protein
MGWVSSTILTGIARQNSTGEIDSACSPSDIIFRGLRLAVWNTCEASKLQDHRIIVIANRERTDSS